MPTTFEQERDLFVDNGERFHLDRWESYAARKLYLDSRGKKRSFRPEFSSDELMEMALRLCDHGSTRVVLERFYATLRRAFEEAPKEIARRHELRQDELKHNVRHRGNSLAFSKLDLCLVELLHSNDLISREAVSLATKKELMAISGIGHGRLRQIRKICPYCTPERMNELRLRHNLEGQTTVIYLNDLSETTFSKERIVKLKKAGLWTKRLVAKASDRTLDDLFGVVGRREIRREIPHISAKTDKIMVAAQVRQSSFGF